MTRLLLIPILLFLVTVPVLLGQSYTLVSGGTITDCNGTLYDDGGALGNYGDNLNLITTICADGSGGTHIRLTFSGVVLEPGDELCFYDGTDINAPLLVCASGYPPGDPFIVQASALNPSGCLTVTFQSDATGNASGFAAVISCVDTLPVVNCVLDAILNSTLPVQCFGTSTGSAFVSVSNVNPPLQ